MPFRCKAPRHRDRRTSASSRRPQAIGAIQRGCHRPRAVPHWDDCQRPHLAVRAPGRHHSAAPPRHPSPAMPYVPQPVGLMMTRSSELGCRRRRQHPPSTAGHPERVHSVGHRSPTPTGRPRPPHAADRPPICPARQQEACRQPPSPHHRRSRRSADAGARWMPTTGSRRSPVLRRRAGSGGSGLAGIQLTGSLMIRPPRLSRHGAPPTGFEPVPPP